MVYDFIVKNRAQGIVVVIRLGYVDDAANTAAEYVYHRAEEIRQDRLSVQFSNCILIERAGNTHQKYPFSGANSVEHNPHSPISKHLSSTSLADIRSRTACSQEQAYLLTARNIFFLRMLSSLIRGVVHANVTKGKREAKQGEPYAAAFRAGKYSGVVNFEK